MEQLFNIQYLVIAVVVYFMNIVPAFMPPTWSVLAFFYLQYDLILAPTVIIGAICATLGRVTLAKLADNYFRRFIPKKFLENYQNLGLFFKQHEKLTIPIIISYAFLPIPSNEVFIIAGLAKLDLKIIAGSFLVGRLISYTFWVTVASRVSEHFETLFSSHLTKTNSVITELIGISIIILIGRINWGKILKIKKPN
jgi:membrane protein YqaA with SNARE-associated domain